MEPTINLHTKKAGKNKLCKPWENTMTEQLNHKMN